MLLIFPPVAKPCEPPAGIARLAGALRSHGISCTLLDANLEGLLHLLQQPPLVTDTWTKRAAKNASQHLFALRNPEIYRSRDRYGRAVSDLNRLLAVSGTGSGAVITLADYQHPQLSPLRSADLIAAAEKPEENPFYRYFQRRLPEVVEGQTVVGFSLNYLSQALCTFAMIGFLKKHYPKISIVLGGGLVTSWVKRPGWHNLFSQFIDHIIAGPGEIPLLALHRIEPSQNVFALPDYSDLPLQDYIAPGLILPFSAASGCYWNKCSFCPERAEGNLYHPLPAQQAMLDLEQLTQKTKPVLLHLLDNAVSPALLRRLTESPPGVPWYGFARIDENLADPDFCRALKRSGCVMLKLGLESGDQSVLDRLHKGIDLDLAAQVLKNLQEADIAVYLYLLFGTPAETESEAKKTLEFVRRHSKAIGFLNLALFNMPAYGDEAKQYSTTEFYEGDLSLYTSFRHPQGWDRKEVRRFLNQEFTRDPVVAEIVRRDPPLFTSNHASFFTPLL